jgi:hypothetical protein
MKETKRDHVNFVRIGFNDACTSFLVKFYSTEFDDLEQAISNVGDYNESNGPTVAARFAAIKHLIDCAEFGRESSPVLYLRLRPDYRDKIVEVIRALYSVKTSKPDESDINAHDNLNLRFWWD